MAKTICVLLCACLIFQTVWCQFIAGETCDTIDGGVGSCISLYNCQSYVNLAKKATAQSMQILRKAHCGFEGNNPKVCCPSPSVPTAPLQRPTSSATTTTTTTVPLVIEKAKSLPQGETCDIVSGGGSTCISIYKCQPYLSLTQEARPEVMQFLRKVHCGFEGDNPKVCCPLAGILTAPPQPPTSTTTTTTTSTAAPVKAMAKSLREGAICDSVDGGLGSCISFFNCRPYMRLLRKNTSEVRQVLRNAHCGFDRKGPRVCCPLFDTLTDSQQRLSSTATTTTTTTTTTAAPETEMSKTLSDRQLSDFVDSLPDPPVCGVSSGSFSRVVGGEKAKLGDFPWMALLGYKNRNGDTNWLCGGSLISSRHILTAAHCIHNHENDLYVVRLGELDLTKEDEGATPYDVLIKQKIKHAEYSANAYTNDIGILILDKDVEFTDLIRPICIPKDNKLRANSFEDYNPLVAGWGQTTYKGQFASHLQFAQLPVVSNDFCTQAYAAYEAQKIDERVLCAGYNLGGKDACQGDSGGPLMQPIWSPVQFKNYYYQIGVVSYGRKCAEAGFPGVYSRITHFIPWIEEQVLGQTSQ
uniref:Coagulation factor-like protein 3 n=1 Tax=Hyphantria cunea TaxID=39466 RepID=Q8I925_HYPCU|nr:coagulation factor-like protein 3 [Hyphantria cunea]